MSTTPAPTTPRSAARIPHGLGFWIVAVAFATQMAFSAVPTPLYAIYQARDGFATIVLTVIFAVYAAGVMLSLYLAGHLSDWVGRRRVIVLSLTLNTASAGLFILSQDVPVLLVARFVNGLGIGILTATATAHLSELGAAGQRRGPSSAMVATFANLGGIGLGPLIGGVLATWVDRPLVTPYALFAVVMMALAALMLLVPETVERHEVRPPYAPQRIAVPASGRPVFWSAGVAAFGSFAVLGTFMGLSSTLLIGVLGLTSHLLAGVAPFVVFASAALGQVATARLAATPQLRLALALAVIGLAGLGTSALTASLALFLVGGAVAGAGVGILFRGALNAAASVAEPHRRGEALAGIFLMAYAGLIVPVLLVAIALSVWPAVNVLVGLSAVAAALVVAAGSRLVRE